MANTPVLIFCCPDTLYPAQMAKSEAPKLEQMAQQHMTGAGGGAAGAGTTGAAMPAGGAPALSHRHSILEASVAHATSMP